MSYGLAEYAGALYGGPRVETPASDTAPALAVEVAFTTDALAAPAWVDITTDVRRWDTTRGRNRELERFQPGRATIVLGNLDRQYDSQYEDGDWFGNLKPMRRVRIRETFDGVTYPIFDGFVDRWLLDYPLTGKDATATVTATDGFKLFARTQLPRSVYTHEVETDTPVVWWRLDENLARLEDGVALNAGSLGDTGSGTFVGPPGVGGQSLIVNDPGSSMVVRNAFAATGAVIQGVSIANADLDLLDEPVWSVEAWVRLGSAPAAFGIIWLVAAEAGANSTHAVCGYVADVDQPETGRLRFGALNSAFTLTYGIETASGTILPGQIHHVVCVVEASGQMVIYLNGVRITTAMPGATSTSLAGVTLPAGGHLTVGHEDTGTPSEFENWEGEIDEFAVYFEALTETRVDAHYAAGTTPWNGDEPAERADRILDEVEWPAAWRELDPGEVTLQSAQLDTAALEHLQKVAETEFGLLFIDRAGNVRFVDRDAVFARVPQAAVFGDDTGEVGYRAVTFDDGDTVIRNRATISRLNGVAKTSEDTASVNEFGRFDYTLDGLLHTFDAQSEQYAEFIVFEYHEPRRRVLSLTLGPAAPEAATDLYPQMLGRELGEAVVVRNRPPGGGDPFEQTCVIEGIAHAGDPKGLARSTTWILSPEFTGNF